MNEVRRELDARKLLARFRAGDPVAARAIGSMSMAAAEALDRAMGCRASRKHCRTSLDLAPTDGCNCDACETARAPVTAPSLGLV